MDSPFRKDLTLEENNIIDNYINKIYDNCRDNSNSLTQLAMQSSSCIFASKAKAREIAKKNFLSNLFNEITGKNRKIRGEIDRDFAVSINACIKMISKLAEENKLTFEFMTSVNFKLNSFMNDVDKEFNKIYSELGKMMQTYMSSLIKESIRIDKLERSVNVIQLESTIEHLYFDNVLYKDLGDNEKVLCIISDFFFATNGEYSFNDLMMLKPMMSKVGLDPNSKVTMESLYRTILNNSSIANKFFESIDKAKMEGMFDFEIPLLSNIKKIEKLETDEKYIVETISNMTGKSIEEIKFDLLRTYANNELNMKFSEENTYFDLSVSIINELISIKLIDIKEVNRRLNSNNTTLLSMYEELGDTYFKLKNLEKAYNNYNLAIENGLESKELYYKICALILCSFYEYHIKKSYFNKDSIGVCYNINNTSLQLDGLFLKKLKEIDKIDSIENNFPLLEKKYCDFIDFKILLPEDYYSSFYDIPFYDDFYCSIFVKFKFDIGFYINSEFIYNYINKFLEFSDNSFDATLDSGVIYYFLKDYDKALEFFERAIKIDNERVEGFINKALVLNTIDEKNNRDLVEKSLNRAIGLDHDLFKKFKEDDGSFIKYLSQVLNIQTTFNKFLEDMGF